MNGRLNLEAIFKQDFFITILKYTKSLSAITVEKKKQVHFAFSVVKFTVDISNIEKPQMEYWCFVSKMPIDVTLLKSLYEKCIAF